MTGNIHKLTLINFCTRFHLYLHVYALLLQDRGLTLLQVSTIESVMVGTIFLMEIPTGVLADRIGRKWSIVLSVFFMLCGELLFLFSRSYPLYLVMALLTGTGFAFASGAIEAMIYDSLPGHDRESVMKRVMGRYSSVGQIAFFISPILGAIIVSDLTEVRFNVAIGLTAAALLIGFLISLTLVEPPNVWTAERQRIVMIFRNGIAAIRTNPRLRRLVMLVVLTTPFGGTLMTTLAAPYLTQNSVSPLMIGLALSFGSLLAAFTQHNAWRVEKKLGERWGLASLVLLPGFSYLLLALIANPVAGWLMIVWMYGTNDMKSPLVSAYQNAMITADSRATVLSLINMVMSLFVAVVAPLYAAIATRSLPLAFSVMGGVILLAGVLLRVDQGARVQEQAV